MAAYPTLSPCEERGGRELERGVSLFASIDSGDSSFDIGASPPYPSPPFHGREGKPSPPSVRDVLVVSNFRLAEA